MSVRMVMPGTLTNVIPEIDAPTIPNATMYHGERRLALKNVSLLASRRAVSLLNPIRAAKYRIMVKSISII